MSSKYRYMGYWSIPKINRIMQSEVFEDEVGPGVMHQSISGANIPPGQLPEFCTYFPLGSRGFVPSELPGGRTYYQSTNLSVDAA